MMMMAWQSNRNYCDENEEVEIYSKEYNKKSVVKKRCLVLPTSTTTTTKKRKNLNLNGTKELRFY
jgi:hypothetical protein